MKLESLLSPAKRASLKKIVAKDRYHKAMLTVTGFEALHRAGHSGCNLESALVELVTMHRDVEVCRVERSKGCYTMFVRYPYTRPQGFADHGFQAGWFATGDGWSDLYCLIVRQGNKTFTIIEPSQREEKIPSQLYALIGDVMVKQYQSEGYYGSVRDDVMRFIDRSKGYGNRETDLEKALALSGCEIVQAFMFHDRIVLRPEYVKVTGHKIEFGYHTDHTYHSLPRTLTIDLAPKLRTAKLADLGIEQAGYYSHGTNHTIVASHVNLAQSFARKYKATKRKHTVAK